MMDGLAAPKIPPLMKFSRSCPPWLCVIGDRRRDLRSIASEVGKSFGAVQYILTDILGMSKVSVRRVTQMLTDDQKKDLASYCCLSCLTMKIIQMILSSELYPTIRHGLTTLKQSQKCRANNGSTLARPLLRNLRGSISR